MFHRSARIFTWLELDSVLKSHPESWTHYRLDMHASKTTIWRFLQNLPKPCRLKSLEQWMWSAAIKTHRIYVSRPAYRNLRRSTLDFPLSLGIKDVLTWELCSTKNKSVAAGVIKHWRTGQIMVIGARGWDLQHWQGWPQERGSCAICLHPGAQSLTRGHFPSLLFSSFENPGHLLALAKPSHDFSKNRPISLSSGLSFVKWLYCC